MPHHNYVVLLDLLADKKEQVAATHDHMTSTGHTHSCPHHNTQQSKGKRSELSNTINYVEFVFFLFGYIKQKPHIALA